MGHRISECMKTIGTRSAKSIMASGHAPHKQAGHMTAPTNAAETSKKFLPIRRRPHMTLSGHKKAAGANADRLSK